MCPPCELSAAGHGFQITRLEWTGCGIVTASTTYPCVCYPIARPTMGKISILREFWEFLRIRKKYWLAPIVIVLVLLSLLIVLTQGSALAPFIYALF